MLGLINFIPKTIRIGKKGLKCRLHFTIKKIPRCNEKIEKGKIGIWYEIKTPTNGKNIRYIVLPKFINENKNLYESIGLYLAEGGQNPLSSFSFGNDEPKIINTLIKCFQKNFGINFSKWSWSICFNEKLKRNESKKITKEREKGAINFWLNQTKIKPELVSKKLCRYSNKNSKGKLLTKKKWGSLTINYGNIILKNIWLKIIEKLIKKTLQTKNKNKAGSILRGWIAGDGYCRYKVYDKPRRELGIACGDQKKIKIIYKLFGILGIKPFISGKNIRFVKTEYLVKAYNYQLTLLHFPKHRNLLKSLLSYKRTPKTIEKLDFKKIEKELQEIERKIEERKELFEKLKNKKLLKLREDINWQFLINGLVLKKGGNYEKIMKEMGCSKTVLINWRRKGIEPAKKYKRKILEKISQKEKEKLIKFGQFFLKGDWPTLFEGLQIFLKMSREKLAQKLKIHLNTIESIVNRRKKIGKEVASKVLNLIERKGKTPHQIVQIYKNCQNINWPLRIKRILIENEYSQRELAEKLGCSRSLVREWLGGLEPTNEYKGKLLEMSLYKERVNYNFKVFIKKYLKIHNISDLAKKLNVSWKTIKNWEDGDKIQLRHLKKIILMARAEMSS